MTIVEAAKRPATIYQNRRLLPANLSLVSLARYAAERAEAAAADSQFIRGRCAACGWKLGAEAVTAEGLRFCDRLCVPALRRT